MSFCSVVIVARNEEALLFATLENVIMQKQCDEIIIVDNGSAPDVISRLQQRKLSEPRLEIITVRGDINFARGCNIATKQAVSEFLVFIKAGFLLSSDALSELVNVLKVEKRAMLSSGIVQNYDGNQKTIIRSQIVTPKSIFLDMIGFSLGKSKSSVCLNEASEQVTAKKISFEVASISSACMCVRASDYKKIGGFDIDFFPQDEELDFSLRVQQIGGRVFCVPSVKIVKLPDDNENRISIAKQSYEVRNIILYLNKFFSGHQPFGSLFLLNILIAVRFTLRMIIGGLFEFFQDGRKIVRNVKAKRLMILALGAVDVPKNELLAGKIVLVTGATSQIGLCVLRRLIASGAAVLALSRGDEIPYYHPHLRWIKGDLTNPNLNLDGYCVDVVAHCAPLWHLPPILEMLEKSEAKRIVAFSSTSIFSNLLSVNDFEKDMVSKLQNAEKLLAERCAALGVRYTIFRPTQIYGVGLDSGVTTIAKIINRFGQMFVYPPAFGRRQPVHVDDLAMAVVNVIDNENSYDKSYNLSGREILTYREILAKLFAIYKKKPRIINSTMLPFVLDMVGKLLRKRQINGEIARRMNDDLVFFHDDAVRDFGFHPRGFLTGGIRDIEGF